MLKPDISIDYIVDLDVSTDLEATSTGSNPLEFSKLEALAERVTKTKKMFAEHKKQV